MRPDVAEAFARLLPGKTVRLEPLPGASSRQIRSSLLQAAARRGQRLSIWEHVDGAIHVSLAIGDEPAGWPALWPAADDASVASDPASLLRRERRDHQSGLAGFASLYDADETFQVATDVGPFWVHARDTVVQRHLRRFGTWQRAEGDFFRAVLRPGMNVIDVGAMIGYFTVLFAQAVGPTGRVLAFEPEPRNFALLCANVRTARVANVDLVRAAAARTAGTITMALSAANFGDHRAYNAQSASNVVAAEAVRIDDVVQPEAKIDVVKTDVQGMDHAVVQGMEETVRRHRPLVLVEFAPAQIEEFGDRPDAVLRYYRSLGYTLTEASRPGAALRSEEDGELIAAVASHETAHTNLLLCPPGWHPAARSGYSRGPGSAA